MTLERPWKTVGFMPWKEWKACLDKDSSVASPIGKPDPSSDPSSNPLSNSAPSLNYTNSSEPSKGSNCLSSSFELSAKSQSQNSGKSSSKSLALSDDTSFQAERDFVANLIVTTNGHASEWVAEELKADPCQATATDCLRPVAAATGYVMADSFSDGNMLQTAFSSPTTGVTCASGYEETVSGTVPTAVDCVTAGTDFTLTGARSHRHSEWEQCHSEWDTAEPQRMGSVTLYSL